MLDLEKEVDEIFTPPTPVKSSTNWLLVSTVALGTILAVVIAAWATGVISIGKGSINDTAANDVESTESPEKRIKGHRGTRIYHLPRCMSYDKIAPQNIRWFNTEENATNAGYRRAKNC